MRSDVRNLSCLALALASLAVMSCSKAPATNNLSSVAARPAGQADATGTSQLPVVPVADERSFVIGNLTFILFHEAGHALISEFHLPVLGREEDAVDQFASVVLIPDPQGADNDSGIVTDSIAGWFQSAEDTALDQIAWWDEHGPDQQRAYQIACLLYGSSPQSYTGLADNIALPAERRETCPTDYQSALTSWSTSLEPHRLANGEAPTQTVQVSYDPPGAYQAEHDFIAQARLLEGIAEELRQGFRLPRAITVKASVCNEPNAFWTAETATLTLCYEMVRTYRELHARLRQAGAATEG